MMANVFTFCDRCSAICFIFLFAAVLHYKVHIFYFKMVFKGNSLVVTFFFFFFFFFHIETLHRVQLTAFSGV